MAESREITKARVTLLLHEFNKGHPDSRIAVGRFEISRGIIHLYAEKRLNNLGAFVPLMDQFKVKANVVIAYSRDGEPETGLLRLNDNRRAFALDFVDACNGWAVALMDGRTPAADDYISSLAVAA